MKNYLSISLLLVAGLLFATTANAQSDKKADAWPEKTAFHAVMSTTFHPAEEGKLEPIKTRSSELVQRAREWMESTPPEEFRKPAIKEKLSMLYRESMDLEKLIQRKGTDEQIKAALSKLHDRFHEIVGLCRAPSGQAETHDH